MYQKSYKKWLLNKINQLTDYARDNSPYYNKLFRRIHLPRKIISYSQFESIPITFRKDLARRNEEFIAVPKDKWADVANTAGTSGKPIFIPFTKKDILRNSCFIAKKFSVFGLTKEDIAYITVPIEQSMWIGGMSVWLGCFRAGTCSLRAGNISIDKHIEFIKRFNPTVIFGLPSFVLKLGEELRSRISVNSYKPRLIVTFGENVMYSDFSRNILGKKIEKTWGAKLISGYGSTEASPGFECTFQLGHHILTEMVYVEIVDPGSLKVLEPGEEGLVVITHFGREGVPLIRYANGDLSFLAEKRCKCGRITPRLGPVLGRMDEMVKIKGVSIYPSLVEAFFLSVPFIESFFIELFTDKDLCDKIKVIATFRKGLSQISRDEKLSYLEDKLKDKFGIRLRVEEARACKKVENVNVKSLRIIDKRIKD